jgi:hypothetical protein
MVISKGIATAHFVGQCDEDPRQSEPEWCTNKFFKQAQQTIRALLAPAIWGKSIGPAYSTGF